MGSSAQKKLNAQFRPKSGPRSLNSTYNKSKIINTTQSNSILRDKDDGQNSLILTKMNKSRLTDRSMKQHTSRRSSEDSVSKVKPFAQFHPRNSKNIMSNEHFAVKRANRGVVTTQLGYNTLNQRTNSTGTIILRGSIGKNKPHTL